MAINFAPIQAEAFKPTVPDFQKGFQQGLENYIKMHQAKYAPQIAEAQLRLSQSQALQHEATTQKLLEELGQIKDVRSLLSNDVTNVPSNISRLKSSDESNLNSNNLGQKIQTGMTQHQIANPNNNQNEVIVSPGNQNLYHIDELMDTKPQYKKLLENQGYTKKVEHKLHPESGQSIVQTTYPSGKVTLRAVEVGKSPEEISSEKEFGKFRAKSYGDAVDASRTITDSNDILESIINDISNDPNARQVVGPVNKYLAAWNGTKEQKELLGRLMTSSGNIALNAAKSIKGAFTGRDLGLINSIKANPGDIYDVFVGKLKAMYQLNKLTQARLDRYAELIHEGKAPHIAEKMVRDEISFEPIRREVNELLIPRDEKGQQFKFKFNTQEEKDNYLNSLSAKDKSKMLSYLKGEF